ncbi:MAG: formylglycine-generating enzyme family protein [Bacteroides sp.]|nr:formylglycine-generating enzyme family protein [Ruminococcus flavefaciens]MCM1554886.1 formylglycine-generating enzyme family protein [Bacteroides sp.]
MNSAEEIAGISPDKMEQSCRSLIAKLLKFQSTTAWAEDPSYSKPQFGDYTEKVFGIDMQMVYVEGGSFMMGCTGDDCAWNERNVHRVTLDSYYIGKFEVTRGQWEKVMGTSIYQHLDKINAQAGTNMRVDAAGLDYPMTYVSWEEATAFCEELSRRTGKKYRLPTEAQWEYAARDGNKNGSSKYSGSSLVDMVAWHKDNSGGFLHPIGKKRDNLLGIYDMSGNACEWCRD